MKVKPKCGCMPMEADATRLPPKPCFNCGATMWWQVHFVARPWPFGEGTFIELAAIPRLGFWSGEYECERCHSWESENGLVRIRRSGQIPDRPEGYKSSKDFYRPKGGADG